MSSTVTVTIAVVNGSPLLVLVTVGALPCQCSTSDRALSVWLSTTEAIVIFRLSPARPASQEGPGAAASRGGPAGPEAPGHYGHGDWDPQATRLVWSRVKFEGRATGSHGASAASVQRWWSWDHDGSRGAGPGPGMTSRRPRSDLLT